jgi:hypothetical protein
MPTLYIETNFLVGLAKGQDPGGSRLVSAPPPCRVAIPGICLMEALSRFEADAKQWRRHREQFNFVLREAKRDLESLHAASLAQHLEESLLGGEDLQREIRGRLETAMRWLADHAEQVPVGPDLIRDHLDNRLVIEDPTDNLILHSVMYHARSNPDGPLAFASENVQDFESLVISQQLASLGIRYFRRVEAALGWLLSQKPGGSGRS